MADIRSEGGKEPELVPELIPEDEEVQSKAEEIQIVSIGTEQNQYAFTFHEERLNSVLSKIPPGWKVSVVSVVGAFRTGKSFLLSWFLRYLSYLQIARKGMVEGMDQNKKWYEQLESLGHEGFGWKWGSDRNTTGIWIWSEPFFLPHQDPITGETSDLAVILVDTQGMFDHETTMALTASIFGLSTLLSSYQIYNVDKRIQEDNLQQLALFSEYGKIALEEEEAEIRKVVEAKKAKEEEAKKAKEAEEEPKDTQKAKKETKQQKKTKAKTADVRKARKPFQQIEFLVRDWQNFEDDEDIDAMESEMTTYLERVVAERDAQDLRETRDQITSSFNRVSVYMFVHPGFAVTKKRYAGEIKVIEPTFLTLLDRYCHRVFGAPGENSHLEPKMIHGRALSAAELGAYVKAYAQMFECGAKFPEASTMLEATANANNSNATAMSVNMYKKDMDRIAGPKATSYLRPGELDQLHKNAVQEALSQFDALANFGGQRGIDDARSRTVRSIRESFEIYTRLNESRNPLAGLEIYIIPMTIALVSYVLRWVSDLTCASWSDTCKAGSDVLSHVYAVVFMFLLIVTTTKAKQITDAIRRLKKAFDAMKSDDDEKKED